MFYSNRVQVEQLAQDFDLECCLRKMILQLNQAPVPSLSFELLLTAVTSQAESETHQQPILQLLGKVILFYSNYTNVDMLHDLRFRNYAYKGVC